MYRCTVYFLCCLTVLMAVALPLHARLIPNWPYDKLLKEADLVVLARAVSSKDSGETFKEKEWSSTFIGVNTTFEIAGTLKGMHQGKELTLLHYRLKGDEVIKNGPMLVSFHIGGFSIRTKNAKMGLTPTEYLLFLKRRPDGRYEAVSGQIDPELSVRFVGPESLPQLFSDEREKVNK